LKLGEKEKKIWVSREKEDEPRGGKGTIDSQ